MGLSRLAERVQWGWKQITFKAFASFSGFPAYSQNSPHQKPENASLWFSLSADLFFSYIFYPHWILVYYS